MIPKENVSLHYSFRLTYTNGISHTTTAHTQFHSQPYS